jgi:hypothetical protein
MFHIIWQILAAISVTGSTGWSNIVGAVAAILDEFLMAQKINQLKYFELKSVFATFLHVQSPGD